MIVYHSDFLKMIFHDEKSILELVWFESSSGISQELFLEHVQEEDKLVKLYQPQYILLDARNFLYVIAPETQTWMDNTLFPEWKKSGMKKIAVLISPDFMTQLSLKLTAEEVLEGKQAIEGHFFEEKESAVNWLFD